ncbi:MAG TPA: hypothetical protein VGB58_01630 [Blastococcus sp.]
MIAVLEQVAGLLAGAVAAAALVAGALALGSTRRPALALSVFLDLLLAAGLLRLVGEPGWRTILTAAAIVALRRLIGAGLRAGGRAWTLPGSARQENSAL